MRILLFILVLVPILSVSQLKVEWQKEFNLPEQDMTGITGLFRIGEEWYCSPSNLAATKMQRITNGSEPAEIYTVPNYVWWYAVEDGQLWTREGNSMHQRDAGTGNIIKSRFYKVQDDWPATSPVSIIYRNSFYYAESKVLCKFNSEGTLIFKKEIGDWGTPSFMRKGGNNIYLYGSYSSIGSRLMQYDTLGNQKWSLPVGDVRNLIADADGNCYILIANGETTIVKYGPDGKEIWSKNTPGQWSQGSFLLGDSLFVCGNISPGAMTDNKMPCAYSIISARTGAVISQQTITISEDKNTFEHFSEIACDGKNIYIGGSVGNQYPKCFLVKLSKEGNTTGIQESKATKSFEIFPNPGGSRFTLSCEKADASPVQITVRNISGQVVYKKEVACNENLPAGKAGKSYTLDLGKQASGTYTVEIVSGKDRTVKKVAVE